MTAIQTVGALPVKAGEKSKCQPGTWDGRSQLTKLLIDGWMDRKNGKSSSERLRCR